MNVDKNGKPLGYHDFYDSDDNTIKRYESESSESENSESESSKKDRRNIFFLNLNLFFMFQKTQLNLEPN